MSKEYDLFKEATLTASNTINRANELKAVSDDYSKGFSDAMWEAREIYMKLEEQPNV